MECYEDSDCHDVITLAACDEENNHKKSHTLLTTDLIDYVVMTYYSIVIFTNFVTNNLDKYFCFVDDQTRADKFDTTFEH